MPTRRRFLAFAASAAAAATGPSAAQAGDTAAASRYIATLLQEGLASLIGSMPAEERAARLARFLRRHVDSPTLPQAVLGRYWERLSPSDRDEYIELFERYLVVAYAPQLANYAPQGRISVVGADAVDGLVVVHCDSVEPGAAPVRVDWFVVSRSDGLRITDVVAAGISARETLRADFTGVIRANGGKVEALLNALRKKVGAG
jgi:phospholipid transport system substrate-binding protein